MVEWFIKKEVKTRLKERVFEWELTIFLDLCYNKNRLKSSLKLWSKSTKKSIKT